MPVSVKIWDQTLPGTRCEAGELAFESHRLTVRDLIRARVVGEVERFSATHTVIAGSLFIPEEAERTLNGVRDRTVDTEVQVDRALRAFNANAFLLFVNGTQATDLDQSLELSRESQVEFIKLLPLIGG